MLTLGLRTDESIVIETTDGPIELFPFLDRGRPRLGIEAEGRLVRRQRVSWDDTLSLAPDVPEVADARD